MHADLEASETGSYVFWIASDVKRLSYLNFDNDPANNTATASDPTG